MAELNPKSLKKWQAEKLEYLRYEYKDLKPGEKCIDIGSYQREWAKGMEMKYRVIVECFEALDNRAAWTHNGELQMGGQFLYTSMYDKGDTGAVKTYKCVDIAPWLQEEIAVLKMNIEGGEYELLKYIIDCGLITNIRHLQVQFHIIDSIPYQSLYAGLFKQLSVTHRPLWIYPFCWESWVRKTSKEVAFLSESAPIDEAAYNDLSNAQYPETYMEESSFEEFQPPVKSKTKSKKSKK